ncbi:unnamed protein product [Caenorhabditis bovis]|uniref:G-protein coupled receptors family 1 profile domain-containing protein n=1 Tax=Caenorhabditis bovis TaxID=2654633 RepID=A0A8S1EZE4_9PELO|nr:unnamed protein product [Caenorhabditis bovis]
MLLGNMSESPSSSELVDDIGKPPEPITSDYVEMLTLVFMFIIGAPLNLGAFTQLHERPISTRLDLLKRSLNYSDLLILFIYVPSRACWLLTYDWRGGDLLCKIVKMMHNLAFQSSSNVIVCIAVDRFLSVVSTSHHLPNRAVRRTKMMLIAAWVIAFIISCPQLFIWQDYLAIPEYNWSQCLQIWEIARHTNTTAKIDFDAETWYSVLHICFVFWIPAVVILLSYIVVLSWVWMNSRPSIRTTCLSGANTISGCDTVDTVLSRASEWNPLKSFSRHVSVKEPLEKAIATAKIIVSDETEVPLNQRPSLSPSEASAVMRNGVHTSSSYTANLNRSRALRVSLLVVAYIVCWLPYNLISLIHIVDSKLFENHINQFHFAHQFIILNSVVNPYLYGLFGPNRPARPNY